MAKKAKGNRVQVILECKIVATKVADSFEEAVDNCLEAIEKQLEKNKNKK